jgi:N-acyl-phosphatidylethanolamine-hydrolysing phospholipase D
MIKSKISIKRPAHHANNTASAFKNPWPSGDAPTWNELFQLSFPFSWYPSLHHHHHDHDVTVVRPDWGKSSLESKGLKKSDSIIGTWLGHAGTFTEFPSLSEENNNKSSVYCLFDPIFSTRAGPTAYTGPGRLKESPCKIEDLPGCDAVFISHNHYDHLDLVSVTDVYKKFPLTKWFVPLGNKKWFLATGMKEELVFEMDWWEDWRGNFNKNSSASKDFRGDLSFRISCVPAQHTSGRSGWDKESTLWCGWVVERFIAAKDNASPQKQTRKGSVYHAGDTGYRRTTRSDVTCPVFKEIGQKFGGFDLSFVPIWRGGTLGFISYLGLRLSHHDMPSATHCSPTDAVAIHLDVKSKNSIGVHFGTFIGDEKEGLDAAIEFCEAIDNAGVRRFEDKEVEVVPEGSAGTLHIGASLAVKID